MEREEGSDGKMKEVEDGMGGNKGCGRVTAGPPFLACPFPGQDPSAGSCSWTLSGSSWHSTDLMVLSPQQPPHPGSPPRPCAMGRDLGAVPVCPRMSSEAPQPCSPGSPWPWWPSPKPPTGPGCGDRQVGDTKNRRIFRQGMRHGKETEQTCQEQGPVGTV